MMRASKNLERRLEEMRARWRRKRRRERCLLRAAEARVAARRRHESEREEAILTRSETEPSEAELFSLLDPDTTKWEPFTATDFHAVRFEPGELRGFEEE
jgi:hypothetical protein